MTSRPFGSVYFSNVILGMSLVGVAARTCGAAAAGAGGAGFVVPACWASGVVTAAANAIAISKEKRMSRLVMSSLYDSGELPRLAQRYQHATDRYGRHGSPILVSRSARGSFRSP